MTSNVGARDITKTKSLGFTSGDDAANWERRAEKVREELKNVFNPEFLNRLDDVIVFHPLNREHIAQIVGVLLKDVRKRLAEEELTLKLTDAATEFLVKHGYDEQYGARPLKRAIQKFIEDPLSEKILIGEFSRGDEIEVDVAADGAERLDFRVLTQHDPGVKSLRGTRPVGSHLGPDRPLFVYISGLCDIVRLSLVFAWAGRGRLGRRRSGAQPSSAGAVRDPGQRRLPRPAAGSRTTMLRDDVGIAPKSDDQRADADAKAIKDLYATNQFEATSTTSCEIIGGKTRPGLPSCKERRVLSEVKVVGPDKVSLKSVKDRVDILIGKPIDPAQVAKDVARIDSLYQSEGYYLARVHVDTRSRTAQRPPSFSASRRGAASRSPASRSWATRRLTDKTIVGAIATKPEGFFWWRNGEFDQDKYAEDSRQDDPAAVRVARLHRHAGREGHADRRPRTRARRWFG